MINLQLNVDYRTNWGESLWVVGSIPALGGGDMAKAFKLDLYGEQTWRLQTELPDDTGDFKGGLILRRGSIEANCTVELLVELCRGDMSAQLAGVLFE